MQPLPNHHPQPPTAIGRTTSYFRKDIYIEGEVLLVPPPLLTVGPTLLRHYV